MSIDIYAKKEVFMGTYKNKTYPLRLDNDLMTKVKIIAEKEDRPVSKQLERIIKQYIEQYEKENGRIQSAELSISKIG